MTMTLSCLARGTIANTLSAWALTAPRHVVLIAQALSQSN